MRLFDYLTGFSHGKKAELRICDLVLPVAEILTCSLLNGRITVSYVRGLAGVDLFLTGCVHV